jgi:predicted ArsR family transcriptional regulator
MPGVFQPSLRRIADLLRSRRNGFWTVDEIAAKQKIHRTVAFDHLEELAAEGVATKVSVKGGGRGRPANAYRYAGRPVEVSYPPQRTVLLAEILARAATKEAARDAAREAGLGVGSLKRLEADYEVSRDRVHARSCIFDSVCPNSRDVVCEVHAGLIEGALESSGRSCIVSPEGPDGMGGCVYRLEALPN